MNRSNDLTLTIVPRRVAWLLGGIAATLCLQSIVLKHIEYAAGTGNTYWLYNLVLMFNVNREGNIPTLYATLLLALCALLLAIIAWSQRPQGTARPWLGLALLFGYMALDEGAAIHEKLTIPLQEGLDLTGYLYFGWVIVGAGVVLAVGLLYGRFWWRLPGETRWLFLLAGVLYVGGALGVEAVSANVWYLNDGTSLTFSTIGTVEELLEMLGVVVLLYALLRYLRDQISGLRLVIGESE